MKRILLVGPYGLGNLLMALPGIRALKDAGMEVDIACLLETTEDLCRTIDPVRGWFGAVYPLHGKRGAAALARTVLRIRRERYDAAVLLLPSLRTAYHAVQRLLGARLRIAPVYPGQPWYHLTFLNHRRVPIDPGLHDTPQTLRLLNAGLGLHLDAPASYVFRTLPRPPGIVGLHPGCKAADAFKRWELGRFASVVRALAEEWPPISFRVFFGPDEQDQRAAFEALLSAPALRDHAGRIILPRAQSMADLFTLVGECGVMIANDSGLMHIAASQGALCAGIFGPTDPGRTGPFSPDSAVIAHDIPCRPCALTNDPRSRAFHCIHPEQYCLTRIAPGQVVDWFRTWAAPRWQARGGLPTGAPR